MSATKKPPLSPNKLDLSDVLPALAALSQAAADDTASVRLQPSHDSGVWNGASDSTEPSHAATTTPPAAGTDTSKHILLVEDNQEVADALQAVLESMGHVATHLPTSDDALAVLQSGAQYDLVLSDVQMPGRTNGIDLAEWVKQYRPEQLIALMTGYAVELERARKTGVRIFAKPFDSDELAVLLV